VPMGSALLNEVDASGTCIANAPPQLATAASTPAAGFVRTAYRPR
jgi:hypothetical protein